MLMRPYAGWTTTRSEMERLRREMNQLFNNWPSRSRWSTAGSYPAMNVWTNEDSAILTAELPGIERDDIDISVEDDTVTLRGERWPEKEEEDVTYHRRERRQGSFARTFRVPFRVDANKVEATFKNGVLNIVLPRAEEDKPKKISVRAG
ncbi:MAG: Hsp20/alpha crystallin family protein [Anaerolineae bacterium]|jgi:HSP20 family protein